MTNNYKSNDRKYLVGEPYMQEHIFEHFHSESHTGFLENVCYIYRQNWLAKSWKKGKLLDPHFKDHGTLGLKYS